jgi:hypothetical protein
MANRGKEGSRFLAWRGVFSDENEARPGAWTKTHSSRFVGPLRFVCGMAWDSPLPATHARPQLTSTSYRARRGPWTRGRDLRVSELVCRVSFGKKRNASRARNPVWWPVLRFHLPLRRPSFPLGRCHTVPSCRAEYRRFLGSVRRAGIWSRFKP